MFILSSVLNRRSVSKVVREPMIEKDKSRQTKIVPGPNRTCGRFTIENAAYRPIRFKTL